MIKKAGVALEEALKSLCTDLWRLAGPGSRLAGELPGLTAPSLFLAPFTPSLLPHREKPPATRLGSISKPRAACRTLVGTYFLSASGSVSSGAAGLWQPLRPPPPLPASATGSPGLGGRALSSLYPLASVLVLPGGSSLRGSTENSTCVVSLVWPVTKVPDTGHVHLLQPSFHARFSAVFPACCRVSLCLTAVTVISPCLTLSCGINRVH